MSQHDVIVIGAGPAGEVCAGKLADEGLDVALVERELVGGECAFYACMPSKALLRPGELLDEAGRVPGAREVAGDHPDPDAALARRDEVIHGLDDSVQLPWLEEREITLVRGQARLDGERRVRVRPGVEGAGAAGEGAAEHGTGAEAAGGEGAAGAGSGREGEAGPETVLEATRAVVVAVGSTAAIPPVPGLRELEPWTNRRGTTAEDVPPRLTILGGGVVGCELAQAWASLGSSVTLVEVLPRLLAHEEPFAGEQVADALRAHGVEVHLGQEATAAERDPGDGSVTLTLSDGTRLVSDELLVAAGRRPRTDDLGLETVGLEPGATIEVDDRMRVPGHDWLYAIGDVNGRALLTHAGKYQARVAAAAIMNRPARAVADGALTPRVAFCEPQVAAVGRTLEQALADGIPARAVDAETGNTAGASFIGKGAAASARIVIDEQRRVLVGATFTGPDMADALHAATIAVAGEVPVHRLVHAIPCFPTRSEVWLALLKAWDF